ncbi:MAG TPA: helix-turn-helix domain-containing protein, partial [Kaistiaceae bacterium]|nr:helix-turn-helix domain-containing protein [Kaistiaceae bacterium]
MSNPDKDQGHAEGLRDVLIAEAMRILETDGLEALSLRAVARAAKVSHAAPYRHFADKDALLAAVSACGFLALAEAMEAAAAGIDDPF